MDRKDYDNDIAIAIEHNAKQWCGNASVKYLSENLKWPVSEDEYFAVLASKVEGTTFILEIEGAGKVYGYYTATKVEPGQLKSGNKPSSSSKVDVGNDNTASKTSKRQSRLGKQNIPDRESELDITIVVDNIIVHNRITKGNYKLINKLAKKLEEVILKTQDKVLLGQTINRKKVNASSK